MADMGTGRKKRRGVMVLGVVVGVALVGVVALDLGLRGTSSTTELDPGQPALPSNIVAGRIYSKFHPLPWIGTELKDVQCPGPLPAVVGARLSCTGVAETGSITIPVTVAEVSDGAVTWSFER